MGSSDSLVGKHVLVMAGPYAGRQCKVLEDLGNSYRVKLGRTGHASGVVDKKDVERAWTKKEYRDAGFTGP